MTVNRTILTALVALGALLVSAGAAIASQSQERGTRAERCEARLTKIAERRGVSVAELQAQFERRALARVDALLASGRISAERAGKLKERIASAELCAAPRIVRPILRTKALLRAAAAYLDTNLREELPGTSLAALAEATDGKSVEGLKEAMLARPKARLAQAVASGKRTQAQADKALARLAERVDRLLQRTFPAR